MPPSFLLPPYSLTQFVVFPFSSGWTSGTILFSTSRAQDRSATNFGELGGVLNLPRENPARLECTGERRKNPSHDSRPIPSEFEMRRRSPNIEGSIRRGSVLHSVVTGRIVPTASCRLNVCTEELPKAFLRYNGQQAEGQVPNSSLWWKSYLPPVTYYLPRIG